MISFGKAAGISKCENVNYNCKQTTENCFCTGVYLSTVRENAVKVLLPPTTLLHNFIIFAKTSYCYDLLMGFQYLVLECIHKNFFHILSCFIMAKFLKRLSVLKFTHNKSLEGTFNN